MSYDGTAWGNSLAANVLVSLRAAQNQAVGAHGTEIAFATTPNGTASRADAVVVQNSGGLSIGAAAIAADPGIGALNVSNGISILTAAKTLTLKQGSNGAVGTFTCISASNVTIANSFVATNDNIIVSYNSGTAGATPPAINQLTGATSFRVGCASGDTAVYNYAIIKNAA